MKENQNNVGYYSVIPATVLYNTGIHQIMDTSIHQKNGQAIHQNMEDNNIKYNNKINKKEHEKYFWYESKIVE